MTSYSLLITFYCTLINAYRVSLSYTGDYNGEGRNAIGRLIMFASEKARTRDLDKTYLRFIETGSIPLRYTGAHTINCGGI